MVVRFSLTVPGTQDGSGSSPFTLCISRPDQLGATPLALGLRPINSITKVALDDSSGATGGCTFALDQSTPPTGAVTATGSCQLGAAPAGFALTVSGTAQLVRTCGASTDSVSATISGTVAVRGP